MIVLVHLFTNLFYNLCKKRINARNSSWSNFTLTTLNGVHPLAQRDAESQIKFDPPMYKQRYERAVDILLHEKWKNHLIKVVDFGCAEFGLFVFLKNKVLSTEILFVDIDELLLRDYLHRLYPLNADHINRRQNPLSVKVFAGSIASPDSHLLNTDAVIALEIIEHLYPDTLDALPYNLFAYVRPKLVIITTPNVEFNILFNNLGKFRHHDHKFEWTREQFQSWATNITLRFPHYTVQFDGIGLGFSISDSYGCCSQLAVFIRKDIICDNYIEETIPCICKSSTCSNSQDDCFCQCPNCIPKFSYGVCTYNTLSQKTVSDKEQDHGYKLLLAIDYPYNKDTRNDEEKLLDEIKYRMHYFESENSEFYNYEQDRVEIPIKRLVYQTSRAFPSEEEVRSILVKYSYRIEECLNQKSNQLELCVIYEMERGGSGSDTEASGYESDKYEYDVDDATLSDWDDKEVATSKGVKTQLHLEVSGSKKSQGALFDSGYQKSPSVTDESPQSVANKETVSLEFKSPNNEKPTRLSNILSVFDNFDKINELDAFHKDKKYFNFASNLPHKEVMKKLCQEIAKHPIAGPSRDHRKGKHPKKPYSSDSDDSVDDVKSITTCILENSLNKIECKDEEPPRANLIQELIPEEIAVEEVPEPNQLIVENGDLANNNRDLEGNNYPAENPEDMEPENDVIDNLDHNNINIDNNNEIAEVIPDAIPEEPPAEELVEENVAVEPPASIEVAWSSREALFDVNSQVDLLEEFEVDDAVAVLDGMVYPNCIVTEIENTVNAPVLLPEESGFPNWLLQIFEDGETPTPEEELHDEPHFYCQGDGLGVHPSTVAINDDADDEGTTDSSDSSSSSSSSSGSAEFASAENHSVQDLVNTEVNTEESNLVVVGQQVPAADQSNDMQMPELEELFENAEGSETNLVTNSCTQ